MRAAYRLALPSAVGLLLSLTGHHRQANAYTYNVLPDNKLPSADESGDGEVYNLMDALNLAEAGDIIELGDGTYKTLYDRLKTVADGTEGSPITIRGGRDAKLRVPSPSVRVEHSWITIQGFTVDGEHDSADEKNSIVNKCVEVVGQGKSDSDALDGFVMKDMLVQNCGGECVRLKNFVVNADVSGNTIRHCGLYDFEFGNGKNGEGIYIGTSTSQWKHGEDRCDGNWINGNTISTCGNECVEVKEGSSGNLIENNYCANQLDSKSGCYCARGDGNTIRYNEAKGCQGVGVRLGGKTIDGHHFGQDNEVYGNKIDKAEEGAIMIRVMPQRSVCGNTCKNGPCVIAGKKAIGDIADEWNATCDEDADLVAVGASAASNEIDAEDSDDDRDGGDDESDDDDDSEDSDDDSDDGDDDSDDDDDSGDDDDDDSSDDDDSDDEGDDDSDDGDDDSGDDYQ